MENVHISQNNSPPPRSKWAEILANFPIIQLILAGAIGLAATWTTVQLTQNSQAAEIRRNAEKIAVLEAEKKETVSKELFEERTNAIRDELKLQRDVLQKILDKK